MIKVLLADDHKMVRDGLSYLLMAAGDIEIIATASSGQQAVECAVQACPDVAVLDVSMPGMDGIEACRDISDHCHDTSILMLSIYNTPEYIRRALRAGAQGYVLKDAAGADLVNAVRTLAAGGQYFSSGVKDLI